MQYLGHILDEKFKIKNSFKEKFKKKNVLTAMTRGKEAMNRGKRNELLLNE